MNFAVRFLLLFLALPGSSLSFSQYDNLNNFNLLTPRLESLQMIYPCCKSGFPSKALEFIREIYNKDFALIDSLGLEL